MYVRQRTWLENGPRPLARSPRRLGMGDCLNAAVGPDGMCPDGTPYTGVLDSGGAAPAPGSVALSFPYVTGGGSAAPANPNSVTVTACSPDMCFGWPFPWVGTRQGLPPGGAPMGWSDSKAPQSCYCKPLITVPSPWGQLITVGLAALIGLKVVRGVMG